MPTAVSASEPRRCTPAVPSAQAYSRRSSRLTTSLEKVEKVVSPPRNPVIANSRACGAICGWRSNQATATPVSYTHLTLPTTERV